MSDWIEVLDGFMKMSRQNILTDSGKISAELAQKKAFAEYESYKLKNSDQLSSIEKEFIKSLEQAHKKLKENN